MQDTQWSIEVVAKSWRRSLACRFEEHDLDHTDSQLLRAALVMRLLLLTDIVGEPSAGVVCDFMRTILGLRALDVGHYSHDWSLCKEWMTTHASEYSEQGPEVCLPAFKQQVRRMIHNRWIMNSVTGLMEWGATLEQLIQWIVFDEKLNLQSLDLRERYQIDYVRTEEDISTMDYDLPHDLRQLAESVLSSFEPQMYPFRPGHGPGATLEIARSQASPHRKNEALLVDDRIREYLRWRYVSEDADDDGWFLHHEGVTDRAAKLVCVPKSMTKNRTISKEPTTLQYLQQDLFRAMDDWISSHHLLRWHIDLHDQAKSRKLAQYGSVDGSFATIDMSKASDLVTLPLLRALAPDSALLHAIMETRSSECIVRDDVRTTILKVAGMGNAICFPTECVVFALCCECACRRAGMVDTRRCYRVFGDDIVIDSRAVPALLEILSACHFVVNREKSFYEGQTACFREACGVWAFGGADITPLRLSRRLALSKDNSGDHCKVSVPQSAGWIDLANESFRRGYYRLNRGIHAFLSECPWYYHVYRVGYFVEKEKEASAMPAPYFLTFDANATQWKTQWRWNYSLQRQECRCLCYRTRTNESPQDVNDLLTWWTLVAREAEPDKRAQEREAPSVIGSDFRTNRTLSGTAGTTPLSWGWKWVPV